LLKLGPAEHVLALTIHHIASDGWSMELLFQELAVLYDAFSTAMPPAPPALLELPTDRPRPPVQSYRGARRALTLPKALADDLAQFSRREGVTLFMTLLAAFKVLLHRYTGQDDIVVGSPTAGR